MNNLNYINTEAIQAVNEGKSVPKRLGEFRIEYVATDGWRGYYEATASKKSGWIKLKDGWVTGDWDDAPEDSKGSNVEATLKALNNKVVKLGGELRVIFVPTSNVFSTAYDVFVRGIDVEQLK